MWRYPVSSPSIEIRGNPNTKTIIIQEVITIKTIELSNGVRVRLYEEKRSRKDKGRHKYFVPTLIEFLDDAALIPISESHPRDKESK